MGEYQEGRIKRLAAALEREGVPVTLGVLSGP
jgi:hypothetical protein